MASSSNSTRSQGTAAVLRHCRMSAFKARQVLDAIRGMDATKAQGVLLSMDREAARVISKVLASAVANAENNDSLDPEELYIASCYADEGATYKRWRPRARGRATRIRKRTCHITVVVARMPEDRLRRHREREAATMASLRARRVARSRGRQRSEEASTSSRAGSRQTTSGVERELEDVKGREPLASTSVSSGDSGDTIPGESGGTVDREAETLEEPSALETTVTETVAPEERRETTSSDESDEIVDANGPGVEETPEGGNGGSDQGKGE